MNIFNIPIYRAKKINSEEYIKGSGLTDFLNINNYEGYENLNDGNRTWIWSNYGWNEIDPTTLAINFPDMQDSENTPIFASLSEDGKGGDMCSLKHGYEATLVYRQNMFLFECYGGLGQEEKIIGIQK